MTASQALFILTMIALALAVGAIFYIYIGYVPNVRTWR